MEINFEGAKAYAIRRLTEELGPELYYHSAAHTVCDVVPAAERLAAMEGVQGEALLLLKTAAYFHDLGYIKRRRRHELIGVSIMSSVLPGFGYNSKQVEKVCEIIMATRIPQSPSNLLQEIMADADLDVLGREDYLERSQALRDELAALGHPTSDVVWFSSQLKFIKEHHYWTVSARNLRGEQKQRNIEAMAEKLSKAMERESVSSAVEGKR